MQQIGSSKCLVNVRTKKQDKYRIILQQPVIWEVELKFFSGV